MRDGVVDAGGQGAGCRSELLDLFHPEVVLFEEQGHLDHVIQGAAGVTADEVRNHGLLLAKCPAAVAKTGQEAFKRLRSRFAHDASDLGTG